MISGNLVIWDSIQSIHLCTSFRKKIKNAKSKHDKAFATSSFPGGFPNNYLYRTKDVSYQENRQFTALQKKRAKLLDYYENYRGNLIYTMKDFTMKTGGLNSTNWDNHELTHLVMCYWRRRILIPTSIFRCGN